MKEKYPWLEQDNERRNMSDREILDKYVHLEKSWIMVMLYKYKVTFSVRDGIGTCLNIEVEIDVIEKLPFLLGHIMSVGKIKIYWTRK